MIVPMTLREARAFVTRHHRHHRAPQGGLFAIGLGLGETVVGVVIVGRPVARAFDDDFTAEVTRLCVLPDHPNACSQLYAAAWRAARAMGYTRLISYTLAREHGSSLKAAGWRVVGTTQAHSWNCASRPRVDTAPPEQKRLWEVRA